MAKSVFFSFHYARDNWRVQQVINMGVLEGQSILNAQDWESVKRQGEQVIEDWIAERMKYKSAVVVLVGNETADRPWVRYEINYAWNNYKPLVGVHINRLANRDGYTDSEGDNPFARLTFEGGSGSIADYVPLYRPSGSSSKEIYASIANNLSSWVGTAYKRS
jgi:hypothetical protein